MTAASQQHKKRTARHARAQHVRRARCAGSRAQSLPSQGFCREPFSFFFIVYKRTVYITVGNSFTRKCLSLYMYSYYLTKNKVKCELDSRTKGYVPLSTQKKCIFFYSSNRNNYIIGDNFNCPEYHSS